MALIKCPECGNSVSDHAAKCPKCGYVLGSAQNTVQETDDKKENNKSQYKKYLPIIIALVIVIVGFRILNTVNENKNGNTGTSSGTTQQQDPTGSGTQQQNPTQGTYQGFVVYNDTELGVNYEIPSNYKVYTGTKGLTYVGQNIDSDGALIPYIMLNWDANYNNPVQYLNDFTDELRKAYDDVRITVDVLNGQLGEYLVYGIQYMYTSSGHVVVDNRYVTVINNEIFMITTKEENQNTDEINDIVKVMFNTLKVGN